jgi:hypothetical protein
MCRPAEGISELPNWGLIQAHRSCQSFLPPLGAFIKACRIASLLTRAELKKIHVRFGNSKLSLT